MKVGIVGMPLSGKTTIFNALTGSTAPTGTFGGGRKANLAVIKVPDERVDKLSEIFRPKKTTYAEISFADIPGGGESGLGDAQTVELIKSMDALTLVTRAFESEAVPHPKNAINPADDLDDLRGEIIIRDLVQVEKRLERMAKERTKGLEPDILKRCREALESERPLRSLGFTESELKLLSGFQFLSLKPSLVVANTGEESGVGLDELKRQADDLGLPMLALCGTLESEIAAIPEQDRSEFLEGLGIEEPASSRFIREAYRLCDLTSFLTAGEDEVKAWTVVRGTLAPAAGGKIHSDIERGFIRAEIVGYDDFIASGGSMVAAREAGKIRLEGKEYQVQDGDIINFRFNV
ncbi:MAG: YchF family ATPase [Chloroflexi bacterium]|nr:YchF family ATPase [Chloroflexota bacterium]